LDDSGGPPEPLAIGWLDREHAFERGPTSEEFRAKLFELCKIPARVTRGFHTCQFCPPPPFFPLPEITHHYVPGRGMLITPEYQEAVSRQTRQRTRESRNGCVLNLGSAEIRVKGANGVVYGAPNLVYHYVVAHDYLPPAAFIDAVCRWSPPEGTQDAG